MRVSTVILAFAAGLVAAKSNSTVTSTAAVTTAPFTLGNATTTAHGSGVTETQSSTATVNSQSTGTSTATSSASSSSATNGAADNAPWNLAFVGVAALGAALL